MFGKIKESISAQALDIEKMIADIDFAALKASSMDSVKSVFTSIDEKSKKDIHAWLAEIKAIKAEALPENAKEAKIAKVRTSETILGFLKSVIDVLVNKVPISNKGILKTGIAGIGIAAAVLNIEVSGIALLVLSKALPKFIMSAKFDELSAWIEKELPLAEADLGTVDA